MSETMDSLGELMRHAADTDAAQNQASGKVTAPVGTPQNPSHQIWTLANIITFCRFFLTLIFFALFVQQIHRVLAVVLYAVASLTDFLDGQVARRTQTVSWLGKIMDPIMDRVLLFTGVAALLATGELPLWAFCVVVGRDLYLFAGGLVVRRYHKRPIDVVYSGKIATALLMTGFVLLLIGKPDLALNLLPASWPFPGLTSTPAAAGILFVYVGLVFSLITAVRYTAEGAYWVRRARDAQNARDVQAPQAAQATPIAAHSKDNHDKH